MKNSQYSELSEVQTHLQSALAEAEAEAKNLREVALIIFSLSLSSF